MQQLNNKVAVITGGNSGIGQGIAKAFVEAGAKVVIFGRNQETLDKTRHDISESILAVQGDVTCTEDLKRLFETTVSIFGKIDVLVANAGLGERLHIRDITEDKFDWMIGVNYRGLYFTVKYALDYLNKHASILLIGSLAAYREFKNHSVYSSTKSAVVKLAKSLSYDLSDYPFRVNSISPGYIETPIFKERLDQDPDYLKKREGNIPLRRIGTPEDIAHAAVFLASDQASYITGADLVIDGGLAATFPEAQ